MVLLAVVMGWPSQAVVAFLTGADDLLATSMRTASRRESTTREAR